MSKPSVDGISECSYDLMEQQLILSSERSLYWTDSEMLIVSDLHLGKAAHFRKHGVPIPRQVHLSDLQRLNLLIRHYEPKTVLFLGDLFHSYENEEWADFSVWSEMHDHIRQILVVGNHDILSSRCYEETSMECMDHLVAGPFLFTHQTEAASLYNISGHIHPCVKLVGDARQGMRLPCFYFGATHGLLPAFGGFTGNHPIKVSRNDRVVAIAGDELIEFVG